MNVCKFENFELDENVIENYKDYFQELMDIGFTINVKNINDYYQTPDYDEVPFITAYEIICTKKFNFGLLNFTIGDSYTDKKLDIDRARYVLNSQSKTNLEISNALISILGRFNTSNTRIGMFKISSLPSGDVEIIISIKPPIKDHFVVKDVFE